MSNQMTFQDLACEGIQKLKPYQPGKPISELEREYGVSNIIKLASNENPMGASPKAVEAIKNVLDELAIYPDGNAYDLKKNISDKLSIALDRITIGNGSNDILELIGRVFFTPGSNAVFSQYSFAVYPIATQACGAQMKIAPALAEDSDSPLGHDLEAIKAKIDENTKVIFIANPNNPTGTWLKKAELFAFLKGVPKNIVVVVDEAYLEYVEEEQYASAIELIDELPNLVVTRTFSKAYGLAGLRIGYGVSSADITNLLNRARQPFNANALALAAATAALADDEHIKKSVENNSRGLKQLTGFFDDNGIGYIPSVGNFICVKVGDKAAEIYEALLRAGIIVRPVDNYGMGQYLRLTVGLPEQNQRMMQTIKELMEK